MKKEITLVGQAGEEQVAAWKKQYPDGVFAIVINGQIGYYREPDIQEMNIASSNIDKDNRFDYFLNLGRETYLGGTALHDAGAVEKKSFIKTIEPKVEGKKGELVEL